MQYITAERFKIYFDRDFPYLPVWQESQTYNTGDLVYYLSTKKFYTCQSDNVTSLPTSPDWEVTQDDVYDYINDNDIVKAIEQMKCLLPASRLPEDICNMAQYWLTAHCLIHDLRSSNAGLASTITLPVTSRSVGSVSESYGLSQRLLQNPAYTFYITSNYGFKYLSLVLPYVSVSVGVVSGWTQP